MNEVGAVSRVHFAKLISLIQMANIKGGAVFPQESKYSLEEHEATKHHAFRQFLGLHAQLASINSFWRAQLPFFNNLEVGIRKPVRRKNGWVFGVELSWRRLL